MKIINYFLKLIILIFSIIQTCNAANLIISPMSVALSNNQSVSSLTITNTNPTDTLLQQTKVVKWTQKNGEDIYTPTNDVISVPPVFNIAPNEKQIIRVGTTKINKENIEKTYRLLIKEIKILPTTSYKNNPGSQGSRLVLIMTIDLPVYVAPNVEAHDGIFEATFINNNGKKAIEITNSGNMHLRIEKFTIKSQSQKIYELEETHTLLPGSKYSFVINNFDNLFSKKDRLEITLKTDTGQYTKQIN